MKAASKIILLNKKQEALLSLRDDKPNICYPGHWDLIGGIIEKYETPLLALRRELFEEVEGFGFGDIRGLEFVDNFIAGIDRKNNHNKKIENYIFKGFLYKPIEKIKLKDEGQDLRFFPLKEAIYLEKFPEHYKKVIREKILK
jgi:8-oxo-dGTP pyrophosphatase MutT (NUDIX family)